MDRAGTALRTLVLRLPTPAFIAVVALFALTASAVIATVCFGRQPRNADEVAQLWHARIFLSGRLALPEDPDPEFFAVDNVIDHGLWFSHFPVGGPAFLALGMMFRAAWLVNPVLLALTVVSLHSFARQAFDDLTARIAILLLALSPMVLLMGASFMNHVPVLWLVTVALAQLARWMRAEDSRGARWPALLIGLALGVSFTVRPLDAVVVAPVIGSMQLASLRGSPARWKSLGWQLVGGLIPVIVLMLVHVRTTGAPLRFGYDVLYGSSHQLGFHTDPYGTVHTPVRALAFAGKYLLHLSVSLLEWPLPALGIVAAGLFVMRRPSRWDLLLIGLAGAMILAYALYWGEGEFRGPRFLFSALPAFVMLLARAPVLLAARTHGPLRSTTRLLFPVCILFAWAAWGVGDTVIGRARRYDDTALTAPADPQVIAREAGLENALVFVRERWPARLVRRVWALGVDRSSATRLLASAHPCAVQHAVEREEARVPALMAGRTARLIRTALTDPPGEKMIARCRVEAEMDRNGGVSYGSMLPANVIDDEGRVSGNVIYVLDLGDHNEVLRSRFGTRRWYLLDRQLTRGNPRPAITPY